ncbi:hypothetical protein D0T84_03465 [Dysgonomonas sp. 521]|uniref:beta-L-arabinofuranosidase domain-containing protein n=1 Tax=Dysgonomonas sp. 521 TaxID=2302932 RepID=UPI0013D6E8E3|nr:beta-L-arabinofuranosidase domain-containing protein [Dysgonomonas sp. 521]NDV93976.1 hypothetical protein [Dysgonomonas sp. 521]
MINLKNIILLHVLPFLMLATSYSYSNKTEGRDSLPQPIDYESLSIGGELETRVNKNMDRLEEEKYQPQNVFLTEEESGNWPGDTEGRTILGLVLDARAAHREPKYLERIIDLIPQKLNEKGYMGLIYEGKMNEQQLSGNGWILRGLCEYYEWKKDEKVLPIISSIANNLFVEGKSLYSSYSIDPKQRITDVGAESGTIQNEENNWMLSSDIGCVFIGMDGLIHAYKLVGTPQMKEVIDEMINIFLKMDLIVIKAQTHASLTACRGLIRYAEITGENKYIEEVEQRWKIYKADGMTENHENYNWFGRYDTWTEPCAIVDSYLLAVQLWQHTGNPEYRDDAELIYYNGICHTQRYNGGFGCDNCPGNAIKNVCLKVSADEAHWCCTMRGGEGVSKASQYSYFVNKDTIIIPFYHKSSILLPDTGKTFSLKQETSYPFNNRVSITITESDGIEKCLKFAIPKRTSDFVLSFNEEVIDMKPDRGLISLVRKFKKDDRIELEFKQKISVSSTISKVNTNEDQRHIYYGPLMLGSENGDIVKLDEEDEIIPVEGTTFSIKNKNITLTPIYHLMDAKVWDKNSYRKQIIF